MSASREASTAQVSSGLSIGGQNSREGNGGNSIDRADAGQDEAQTSSHDQSDRKKSQTNAIQSATIETNSSRPDRRQHISVGRFFCINLVGSLEDGYFDSVNDVYVKFSIVAGPDWILSSGTDVGISQISRYRLVDGGARRFVWNHPISVGYRAYNFYGWPQIVVSVYSFDTFGNDQILGYGCTHLPVNNEYPPNHRHLIRVYCPQSSSSMRQFLSWITGKKPELVDSNLMARGDCRSLLQMVMVGRVEVTLNLLAKDLPK